MAAPRQTFTHNQLVELGSPFNTRLIQAFHAEFPQYNIDAAVRHFIPELERKKSFIEQELVARINEAAEYQEKINEQALELANKRIEYNDARAKVAAFETYLHERANARQVLIDKKTELVAALKAEIVSSPTARPVKVKDKANYDALLREFNDNNDALNKLTFDLLHDRNTLRLWNEKLNTCRAELNAVNSAGANSNNHAVDDDIEAVVILDSISFSEELEQLIQQSQLANMNLIRVNNQIAKLREDAELMNECLRAASLFAVDNPFTTVDAIENLLSQLQSLKAIDLQDHQTLFHPLKVIATYFANNKKTNPDHVSPLDSYVHQYNLDPMLLLNAIASQFASVIHQHDEVVLHNQSTIVRKCIATLAIYVNYVQKKRQNQGEFQNDEAVRKYYRKMLSIAQLYHQRLRELGETYLADLIENEIIHKHLFYDPDMLNVICKIDVTEALRPISFFEPYQSRSLDVEPMVDLLNDAQLENLEYNQYAATCEALTKKLDEMDQDGLLVQMVSLFKQDIVSEYIRTCNDKPKTFDIKFYTNWLRVTHDLLVEPAAHIDTFIAMMNVNTSGKPAILRRRKSLALAVVGAAIFAGGLTMGFLSLGVLSPIAIAVMSIGVAMSFVGVAAALTTAQKGIAEHGECVKDISMFNAKIKEKFNHEPLQLRQLNLALVK